MTLADQDRPLNKRGKRDALHMAQVMAEKEEKPDAIITSPALRASKTALEFKKALKVKKERYFQDPRIYHALPDGIMDVLRELPNDISVVYLFAHNPGLTMLVNYFTEEEIANVPTGGICKVRFDLFDWKQLSLENGILKDFYYPRQFFTK